MYLDLEEDAAASLRAIRIDGNTPAQLRLRSAQRTVPRTVAPQTRRQKSRGSDVSENLIIRGIELLRKNHDQASEDKEVVPLNHRSGSGGQDCSSNAVFGLASSSDCRRLARHPPSSWSSQCRKTKMLSRAGVISRRCANVCGTLCREATLVKRLASYLNH